MHDLVTILERVRAGELTPDEAAPAINALSIESLDFATIDHQRRDRCGGAEVVFAAGKSPEQVVEIMRALLRRQPCALATRCGEGHVEALRAAFVDLPVEIGRRAGVALVGVPPAATNDRPIPIVTAGTSDESVAEEATMTCVARGHPVHRVNDVGVAGLHRLAARLPELRRASVVICIAGMEGALPSVVSGLLSVPVIAVPTSVGYGAAFNGLAALLGMLTSCASGVVVTNIDNGFGAANVACMINAQVTPESADTAGEPGDANVRASLASR